MVMTSTLPDLDCLLAPPSPALSSMASPVSCYNASTSCDELLQATPRSPQSPGYCVTSPASSFTSSDTFSLGSSVPSSPISLAQLPRDVSDLVAQHEATLRAPRKKRTPTGLVPRAQQNRLSAQKVRDRVKAKEQFLEASANAIENENAALEAELATSRLSHVALLAELEMLKQTVSDYAVLLLQQPPQPLLPHQLQALHPIEQDQSLLLPTPITTTNFRDASASTELILGTEVDSGSTSSSLTSSLPSPILAPLSPALSASDIMDTPASPDSQALSSSIVYPPSPMSFASSSQHTSTLAPFGSEHSCESAVLAGTRPQQQDILNFMVVLQLLMQTTLSWANAMKLMVAMSMSSNSSQASSMFLLASCKDAVSKVLERRKQSKLLQGPGHSWPPRLAVT